MMTRIGSIASIAALAGLMPATGLQAQSPPLPTDIPVWLVGHPALDGQTLHPYSGVRFAMGRAGKDGPLAVGESVRAAAHQSMTLAAETRDGRDVWVRSAATYRAGETEPVVTAEIVMDRATLAPIEARLRQGEAERVTEYDWVTHRVRTYNPGGNEGPVDSLDLLALEAGAHETWMAAIPWRDGLRVMIPSVLAGGGGKWWAVPHVVGSEPIDIGDGVRRDAWVVEMDWWGMGAEQGTFTPGGGVNDTAGSGGKYWVLKEHVEGLPRVVRVRTEVDATADNVVQIQAGM